MIFIDRSIPKSVAVALKQVRDDVRWLEDEFSHDVRDDIWLRHAGEHGWLVITRDKYIRRRQGERDAIVRYAVGGFCLTQGRDSTRWGYLKLIVGTLDEMESRFEGTERPFLFGVNAAGAFRRII